MRVDPWSKLYFYIQNKILAEARFKLKALDTSDPEAAGHASYILVCKHIDDIKIQDAYHAKKRTLTPSLDIL